MDTSELGKKRMEELITEQMRSLDHDSGLYTFLWWSPDPQANRKNTQTEVTVPLRLYKGNSWRLIEFSQSDLNHCSESPELLQKYEGEIKQILMDLEQ